MAQGGVPNQMLFASPRVRGHPEVLGAVKTTREREGREIVLGKVPNQILFASTQLCGDTKILWAVRTTRGP